MNIDILGIDLAKRVFQLHGADRSGHALHGSKVMRAELLSTVRKLGPKYHRHGNLQLGTLLGATLPGNED
jgi:hypothetical protein